MNYTINVIPICLPEDDNKLVNETGWIKGYGCMSDPYDCKYLLFMHTNQTLDQYT